ncbi:MAG: histidine kinase [Bacteroidota bacterium]
MKETDKTDTPADLGSAKFVLVRVFIALIVLLIHVFVGISFFCGPHTGYPERWNIQFFGLLITSACLAVIMYSIPLKWILAWGFSLRSIIALLIFTAMPNQMSIFSWLVCSIIGEVFLFMPRSLGIIVSGILIFLMTLQRLVINYTWSYYHPAPKILDLINLWIECVIVLLVGLILGTMNQYLKKTVHKMQDYRQSNIFLVETNLKLQEYTLRTKHESIINERNRISREIHDSVGYILTNLIMILDLTRELLVRDSKAAALEKLNKGIEQAKLALSEVRRAVRAMRPQVEINHLQAIPDLLDAFTQATGVEVSFCRETPEQLGKVYEQVIYRVIQEALINSFRHGQANRVMIKLSLKNQRINLVISDNGLGTDMINLGCGLMGIKERVEALEGSLMVDSATQKGFIIRINLPWDAEATL